MRWPWRSREAKLLPHGERRRVDRDRALGGRGRHRRSVPGARARQDRWPSSPSWSASWRTPSCSPASWNLPCRRSVGPWSQSCSTPPRWAEVARFRRPHRRHVPPRASHGGSRASRSTGPRCATRSGRTPSTSCYRALDHARQRAPTHRRRAAHRQRPEPEGRRLGVLLRRRPAHPRPRRVQVLDDDAGGTRPTAARRSPAHPRGAAAHPLHAQGGDRGGPRLGGRRRARAARRVRPHDRQRRARPVQADRRRRRLASTRGYGSPTSPRQVGQKFAREMFFLAEEYAAAARVRDGRGQRASCRTPTSSARRSSGPRTILAKSPTAIRMLEVRVQRGRRRAGRPAGVRRRGDPPGVRHRRGRRGPRRVPGEAPTPTGRRTLAATDACLRELLSDAAARTRP